MKKEVDRLKMFKDKVRIPYAYRGVRVVAGRSAGPLFHKEVTVEGADEDLSFNIMIPLPTSPQPLQGSNLAKEHYNNYLSINILVCIIVGLLLYDI